MTLGEKQRMFATKLVPRLIRYIERSGYQITFGDAYRDPRVHGEVGEKVGYGSAYSQHKSRLAIDFNLFKNGKYLDKTEDHRKIGEWWERQHESCCWGGRFGDKDGNHYSMEHEGRK